MVQATAGSSHRDYFVHTLCQWETTLHCNVLSHWQRAYTKWSLLTWSCIHMPGDCFIKNFLSKFIAICLYHNVWVIGLITINFYLCTESSVVYVQTFPLSLCKIWWKFVESLWNMPQGMETNITIISRIVYSISYDTCDVLMFILKFMTYVIFMNDTIISVISGVKPCDLDWKILRNILCLFPELLVDVIFNSLGYSVSVFARYLSS